MKVQMQMEGKRRLLGLPPRVTSMWGAFANIYNAGGIVALWKGQYIINIYEYFGNEN